VTVRSFRCPNCSAAVFFDDDHCLNCDTPIGFSPELDDIVAAAGAVRCEGYEVWRCPWLLADGVGWCRSCRLDLYDPEAPSDAARVAFERAKRRVVRQLINVGIDLAADPQLCFRFAHSEPGRHVTTGHADGLVTLDLAEADPVTAERVRAELGEAYRTPLGHVRHEVGHWHWQAWVATVPERLDRFRELFGDERADYSAALDAHYARGDDGSWRDRHVTYYASAHPWEDYAESFAHVFHLRDTMETAAARATLGVSADIGEDFDDLYRQWLDLSVAINELARSMGVADLYPFAPPPPAVDKLRFVYQVLLDRFTV
jgi:hypothetical protein